MKTISVLLVDDEVEFTASLRRVLSRRGFDVEVANNGLSALPLVAEKGFDVVVLDIKMPGMDGLQAFHEIKRLAPRTQVIMLTGHFSIDEEEAVSASGAFAYLLKPFPILKLVDFIAAAAEQVLT
jgi:two-component system, OmpR family, response regulator